MSLLKLFYSAFRKTAQLGKYEDCSLREGHYHLNFIFFFSLLKLGLKSFRLALKLQQFLACLLSSDVIVMPLHLFHFKFQPQT